MKQSLLFAFLLSASVSLAGCAATPSPMPTPLPETPTPSEIQAPVVVAAPARPAPTKTPVAPRPTPPAAGWKPEFTGGPRLKVSAESRDVGTVYFEQPVILGFQLLNVGDAPLVMKVPQVPRLVEGC